MHIVSYVLAFIVGLVLCGLNFSVSGSASWALVSGATFALLAAAGLGVIELHIRGLVAVLDNILKARVLTAIVVLLIVAAVDALGLAGAWFGAEFAREAGLAAPPVQEQADDIKPWLIICLMALPVIIALDIGIRAIRRRDVKPGTPRHRAGRKSRKALKAEFARLLVTADDRNPDRYIVVSSGVTAMSKMFDIHFGSPEKFSAAGRYAQPAYLEGLLKIEEGLRGSGQFDLALGASLFRRYLIALSRGQRDLASEFRAKLAPFIEESPPEPVIGKPMVVVAAREEPVTVDAVVENPVVEKPVLELSAVEKPVADETVSDAAGTTPGEASDARPPPAEAAPGNKMETSAQNPQPAT